MHIVSETGDENMLKFLHSLGADANLMDNEEKTPLHIATEKGHYKIVDMLIEKFKVPVLNRTRVSCDFNYNQIKLLLFCI